MKKSCYLAIAIAAFVTISTSAFAQQYLVTYFRNDVAVPANRSASITSVTNQSAAAFCNVTVRWRNFGNGAACNSVLALAPQQQVDFCTRGMPGSTTICNALPACAVGVALVEGNATVSVAPTNCPIAVSARTVYTQTAADTPISGITDAKVVRFGASNIGD